MMSEAIEFPVKSATVLAIDDDPFLLEALQITLVDAGYQCLIASNARDALELLTHQAEIDIVLSDLSMPGMGGLALLEQIHDTLTDRLWLQVLFMTGHANLENALAALKLRATDFLLKPVCRVQLLKAIKAAFDRACEQRQAQRVWQQKALQLANLGNALTRAAKQLEGSGQISLAPLAFVGGNIAPPDTGLSAPDASRLAPSDMLALIDLCRMRARFFSGRLFADPVWAMLLEVLEANLLDQTVPVSNFRLVSDTSATTALRRLEELERANYVFRCPDPADGRRSLVSLTEYGKARLQAYLSAFARQIRQLTGPQAADSPWMIEPPSASLGLSN